MLTQFTPFIYNYRGYPRDDDVIRRVCFLVLQKTQFFVGHQNFSAAIINAVATNTVSVIRLSE